MNSIVVSSNETLIFLVISGQNFEIITYSLVIVGIIISMSVRKRLRGFSLGCSAFLFMARAQFPEPIGFQLLNFEDNSSDTQIRAEIDTITYHSEDTGWTVIRARNCDSNFTFTATGHFATIFPGESFQFFGSWGKHASFGKQFKIERAVALRPSTKAAIERYLSSGLFVGIGPKTAAKIVGVFKHETLDILDNSPERLSEVPTLGRKKIRQITKSWCEMQASSEIMMFLSEHGISHAFAHRIIKFYGKNVISLVSSNPYRLAADISGIGFVTADGIAMSLGIDADSNERIQAGILFVLALAEDDGHCFLFDEQLSGKLLELLEIEQSTLAAKYQECVDNLCATNNMVCEEVATEGGQTRVVCYSAELLLAESSCAQMASDICKFESIAIKTESLAFKQRVVVWVNKYSEQSQTPLSEQQKYAVVQAAVHKVFILTGGPGVGKTTTANTIIRLFKAMSKSISLAAPTGRAAQRLSEVSMTGAKTIHRLLEWNPSAKTFERSDASPLVSDVVLIDEASMLDIRLADSLFRAIKKSSQVVLIGDTDQLPSVGPGNVLRDLIDSKKIASVELTEIFRQAAKSKIIQTSHAINRGECPEFPNDEGSDCRLIEVNSPMAIRATIEDLIRYKLPEAGYNSFRDIQVLTPMNRGDLGTVAINDVLQGALNPHVEGRNDYKRKNYCLRVGDKVIQCVNNYDLGVFNGDIGFVKHTNSDGAKVIVQFPAKKVKYESDQATDLKLAYAITIHKAQGSEFPVVIIPTSMQHFIMLQRNLMYTGLTRARKLAIFVGSRKALAHAAGNQKSDKRQTRLRQRILEGSSDSSKITAK